jgi:hypothetical protein
MNSEQSSNERGRLLRFIHRRSRDLPGRPVADLGKYEGGDEHDDYRHRMVTNVAAFVFLLALVGAGVWIVDTMASVRKNQDCVMSGRRNCAAVDIHRER